MRTLFRKLRASRYGATAVEYSLILAFIAVAASGAIGLFGNKTVGMWNYVRNQALTSL